MNKEIPDIKITDDGHLKRLVVCDTNAFFDKMSSPKFIRLSFHYGAIEDDIFYTEIPPENVPGIIENVMDSIVSDLKLKMPRERWYSFKRKPWPWNSAHNEKNKDYDKPIPVCTHDNSLWISVSDDASSSEWETIHIPLWKRIWWKFRQLIDNMRGRHPMY